VEAAALQVAVEVDDEVSLLRVQLEAMRAAIARSEREGAVAGASRAEAQAQLLGRFQVRFPVLLS
jgi:hypothetical protein